VIHHLFNSHRSGHGFTLPPALLTALCTGLLVFSQAAFAMHDLPEFTANYAIQKFGIKVATAEYDLSYTNRGYKFAQHTELYGLASLLGDDTVSAVSYVDEVGDKLLLQKHRYRQTGREKNRDEDIDIQWHVDKAVLQGKISGVVRSKKIDLTTDSEIWEVLSFQIPLMLEAKRDIREYPYKALLTGEIDTYNFVLKDTGETTFAGKEYSTLHLVRQDPNRDRQLQIWLIPELHNIPVVVENYRDGKIHSRMQLEQVQFNNQKPLLDESLSQTDDDDF
jgi:hypothetical protein